MITRDYKLSLFVLLLIVISNQVIANPINDELCDATTIPSDGSCFQGTTVDATPDYDWGSFTCSNIDESTVYFETTIATNTNSITIDINNFIGNIAVSLWTVDIDCNNDPTHLDSYCGNSSGFPITLFSIEGNLDYYIQVATAVNQESSFEICVTENHPPTNCATNDFCSQAEAISITTGQDCTNSLTGCNFGAAPSSFCFPQNGVVWYSFQSDSQANLLNLYVESTQVENPNIALFRGDCMDLIPISDCHGGSNGRVSLINYPIEANTLYHIAVGNGYGAGGVFEVCGFSSPDESFCVTESRVYVQPGSPNMGSADTGPFKPGEKVELCFEVTNFIASPPGSGNNCQWLHGIIPVFGKGWDTSSFDLSANLPPALYGGGWDWFENEITYNHQGSILTVDDIDGDGVDDICHNLDPQCPNTGISFGGILPPGWFFTAEMASGPNSGFGDGNCCNCVMGPWTFCFEATTLSFPECEADSSSLDCSVRMFTLADGETGSWAGSPSVCEADIPATFTASLNCSDLIAPPTYLETEVCNGELFSLDFSSNNPLEHYFVWDVEANNYEATSGYGQIMNQRLINETTEEIVINISVFAVEKESGFQSVPVVMPITVLPKVVSEIMDLSDPICPGACIDLISSATGGSGLFVDFSWNNNLPNGQTSNDCPTNNTSYAVTITDDKGCFDSDTLEVLIDFTYQDSFFVFQGSCDPSEVGIIVENYQNVLGCDSIVTTTTSLMPSDTSYLEGSTCDENEVGVFINILMNQNLCDSIVIETINLDLIPAIPEAPQDIVILENEPPFELSINAIPNATAYLWTVPVGVQILSGQSSTSITVDWGTIDGLVCVSSINECGSSEADCSSISIDFENSQSDLKEAVFSIYPSPAEEYINIIFRDKDSYELSMFDGLGSLVLEQISYREQAALFVGDLAAGVYWLKISKGREIFSKKVYVK